MALHEVTKGARFFISRFFDELKGIGESLRRNSRLVVQKYEDEAATEISTRAQTIQLSS